MACCNENTRKKEHIKCPECREPCINVSIKTLLHQLQFPENLSLDPKQQYAYCPDPLCHAGYFSNTSVFTKKQLRAFKPETTPMLCYCFDITQPRYLKALSDDTHQPIKEFVTQQTKASLCACEIRNPSGRCCLIDFKRMEKTFKNSNNSPQLKPD